MIVHRVFIAVLVVSSLTVASEGLAQHGMNSMTVGAARANLELSSQTFRVEEVINYHRHDIPIPTFDHPIAMDLKWLKKKTNSGILQIGLATPHPQKTKELPPLNLVLVIDQSGSMEGSRIRKVKEALHALVPRLGKKDKLSIVGFHHKSNTYCSGVKVKNKDLIIDQINQIRADGSTNLHAGLMEGYRIASKHFRPEGSNRVILLTDGRANTGVTNSETIAAQSKEYNDKGIELSTIGLGNNFNYQLLRKLADEGKGQVHFVGDQKDIKKTFIQELESILATSATDVSVSIRFKNQPTKVKVHGYNKKKQDGKTITIPLQNMTFGATAVIMIECTVEGECEAEVCLNYVKYRSERKSTIPKTATFNKECSSLDCDQPVFKNYTIARLSSKVEKSLRLYESGKCSDAEKILKKELKKTRASFPAAKDSDVDRAYKIAKNAFHQIQNNNLDYAKQEKRVKEWRKRNEKSKH